jgi:mannosyltransferase OCH1-like enzyme
MTTTIPKIIHQIWIQGEHDIPEKLKINKNKIQILHPDWEYVLWDEISVLYLLKNTNEEWLKRYYKFDYLHQKVDYAKLIILYIYGGIFIDMDAYTIKKLDSLFHKYSDYDFIVSYIKEHNFIGNILTCRKMGKCLNNGIYIAKPKVDILSYLIDNVSYKCSILDVKMTCISNTTGPIFFDNYIQLYINKNHKKNKSKILILDNEYLEPCSSDFCEITDNTYIRHEHNMSWFNSYIKEFIKLYLCYSIIFNSLFILLVIFMIYLIFYYFYKYFSFYKKIVKKL